MEQAQFEKGKNVILSVGAVACIGFAVTSLGSALLPLVGFVGVAYGMTLFSGLNHKEWLEEQEEKRGRRRKSIDADEIIPPSHTPRQSRSNETVDVPFNDYRRGNDMERERQLMRARMKEEKLRRQLAETRSAIRTMEDPTE